MSPSTPKLKVAIADLKNCNSLRDFAILLGMKPAALSYMLYKLPEKAKYTSFPVAKRGGGERVIDAPTKQLKALQRRVAGMLSGVLVEIEGPDVNPKNVPSHGFQSGRSILTNAAHHVRRRHVLNIDLVDFFHSFNFGRVRGFFISNKRFNLNPKVATIIAQITCFKGRLPQGAPTSPIITNLICRSLDTALLRFCRRSGAHYTRYADDISISTNEKYFPRAIAEQRSSEWCASEKLEKLIFNFGFKVNLKKSRMSSRKGRQSVTGLTVNRHVNVTSSYYRKSRAMVDRLVRHGNFDLEDIHSFSPDKRKIPVNRVRNFMNSVLGWAKHTRFWPISRAVECCFRLSTLTRGGGRRVLPAKPKPKVQPKSLGPAKVLSKQEKAEFEIKKSRLLGVITHIYNVKRFAGKLTENKGTHRVALRLFYYDLFWGSDLPTIVTEGKTDNIYIREALKRLGSGYPGLYEVASGRIKLRFYNHSSMYADVLNMKGGEGDIKNWLANYVSTVNSFDPRGGRAPVVVLIDNDGAGAKVYSTVKNTFLQSYNKKTGAKGDRLAKNLYFMSTDPVGTEGDSCIEDHFSKSILSEVVDGRTFVYKAKPDSVLNYDKIVFANKVVRRRAVAADFAGFVPILDRLEDIVKHHA